MIGHPRLAALLGAFALTASAHAAFPERPITFIVPFPPGGSTDTPSRIVAEKMAGILGQPIVVENRAGASGQIGAFAAARAKPDGYTMVMIASATHTLPGVTGKTLPYDPVKDFRAVGTFVTLPLALVGNVGLPATSLAELVPYLRENGDRIAIGVPSTGSVAHFSAEKFLAAAKAHPVIAHYQGDSAILTDLIGGNIQLGVFSGSSAAPMVASGKVRGYAVAGATRLPMLPDVPTVAEAGMPDVMLEAWYGIAVPAGTPDETIATLNDALKQALADPQTAQALRERGFQPKYSSAADLDRTLVEEPKAWEALVRENQITFKQ
ncbi:tripartite tricarboxylate transporter substrate binding protein [Verticiella sediminum]|uniref:Tripartite tricarboxylate transporter substrate binding protein n=1 Tax=Verticiella sediminum TaxID=1247510 RepID=A0A556AEA8_9BURK|nr:tripartite tricarboxylate transporter substrate binding protein [Verticiella sediminum]TSH91228.1 tripartite tricarboxylate transporter substrate binding protein [Verticiella sediminum]